MSESIDWSFALEAVEGNHELLSELAGLFAADYPQQLELIHECQKRGDSVGVRRAAHLLKGSLKYFGDTRAAKLAAHMELLAKDHKLADIETLADSLAREIADLLPQLWEFQNRVRERRSSN